MLQDGGKRAEKSVFSFGKPFEEGDSCLPLGILIRWDAKTSRWMCVCVCTCVFGRGGGNGCVS